MNIELPKSKKSSLKKEDRIINTGLELGIISIFALAMLLILLLTGCTTAYIPAEDRCSKAGLGIDKMKIGELPSKQQEVIVECSKPKSLLSKPK